MQDFNFTEYIGVFLDEVEEQLQILDTEIIRLEKDPLNSTIIGNIFRAAHTLKGSSSAMGFEKMKELTHQLESIFDLIRNKQLNVNKEIIDIIFQSIDLLKKMREAIIHGQLDDINIDEIVDQMTLMKSGLEVPKQKTEEIEIKSVFEQEIVLDEYQKNILSTALENGFDNYIIHIKLTHDSIMKSVRAFLIFNNLKEAGEIIATYPSAEEIEGDNFNGLVSFVLVTTQKQEELHILLNQVSEIDSVIFRTFMSSDLQLDDGIREANPKNTEKYIESELVTSPTASDNKTQKLKINPTVRVDVDKLEHLMNLVGELVIDQTRLIDVKNRFHSKSSQFFEELEILSEVTTHFNRVISELQEGMMKTRMLPIEQLFNRFPRLVRDTANGIDKEIDFTMVGKETELDRTLIEEIGDPLIHLLRNSIDHGIEKPEERERIGKQRKGKIVLTASHQENHIVITISDDGRGIDPEKIKQAALKNGVITEEEATKMTPRDLIFLIFKSGLSTVNKVTDLSGRGVGMDIVRSHIERLNGMIDIETHPGKGTTFTIKLPLTLAIIRSLLIELGQQTFAIPLANVLEIIRLTPDDVQMIKNKEVAVVRGNVLPLVRMDKKLGINKDSNEMTRNRRITVIVVGIADQRIGIIAERTLGNQEIVIKSLGQYIGNPQHIAGATIMGNGNVALILDVTSIVSEEGTRFTNDEQVAIEKESNEDKQISTFKLADEEYGIDISYVKDIILVPKITKVVNASPSFLGIINLRGQVLPIIDLRERFNLPQREMSKKTRIIVVKVMETEIGYLVDEVTQVIKVNKSVIEDVTPINNTTKFLDTKLMDGVCRLDERLVVLLNLDYLVDHEQSNIPTKTDLEKLSIHS